MAKGLLIIGDLGNGNFLPAGTRICPGSDLTATTSGDQSFVDGTLAVQIVRSMETDLLTDQKLNAHRHTIIGRQPDRATAQPDQNK
jgi:hypothetical protein